MGGWLGNTTDPVPFSQYIYPFSSTEHLRGSKEHKIYRQLKMDLLADRAESVAQWTDEEEPKAGYDGRQPHSGAHRLGKQIIVSIRPIRQLFLALQ